MRFALAGAVSACMLLLQAPAPPPSGGEAPVLHYGGKPLRIGFECTADDVQWAGMACSEDEPCPLYLELSAVEAVGNKVFVAGNIHSAASTLYSILLSSDDSGRTWREPHDRLRGCGLDRIQFVDFENGWVSGQLLQPLPQDPFFLITSDGGKSWRQRPVFGENRPASILQYWFASRGNGSLVIDRAQSGETGRYELYESSDGGDSWTLRESNDKPLRLKRTGYANTDWRIRADAATKAFCIERRQGERWNVLASFAVGIGACKPSEAAPAPESEAPKVQ
jgi:hypothetical protein